MGIIDKIQLLNMEVDTKYYQTSLIEALEMYHKMIEENIMQPRENQLNKSGIFPQMIHFNSNN